MMQPQIKLSAAGMVSMFRAMGRVFQQEHAKILEESARDTAQELAKHSLPAPGNNPLSGRGNTAEALKQGEENVRRDLYNMFIPMDSLSVKDLVKARNTAVFDMAKPIDWRSKELRRAWEGRDMDTLYEAFKRSSGTDVNELLEDKELEQMSYIPTPTVQDQYKMMNRGRWDGKSRALVRDRRTLAQFVARRLQSVGTSVNGWVSIAKQFKGTLAKLLPGRGSGSAKLVKAKGGNQWVLSNKYGDPNGMLSSVMQKVTIEQQQALTKKVHDLITKSAKAANAAKGRPTS